MTIERFYREIADKTVAFIGIGVSHEKLIETFAKRGIRTLACDKRPLSYFENGLSHLEEAGAILCLEEGYERFFEADIVFRTPGMSAHAPELVRLREMGKVITSEMEVFFDLCPCKTIGVTGSDGKTTTTTIISEFLKKAGYTVHLGGNIGTPLLYQVGQMEETHIAVVELSSFQLITMRNSPDIALITNVEPNHLDVHKTMEEYTDAKKNLVLHQNAFSKTALNANNERAKAFAPLVRGNLTFFGSTPHGKTGAFLREDGMLCYHSQGETTPLFHKSDIRILGEHNVENFLAAITAVWGMVPPHHMKTVARQFSGVAHRIEFVRELDGVRFYNDSIASSPTRTMAGLASFEEKIIMIAGGYDKKIPYAPLAPKILEKVKVLILMGKTGPIIEKEVKALPDFAKSGLTILHVQTMEDAVAQAKAHAQTGDTVSLSPASASFDMYRNFEVRGNHFKDIVRAL